MEDFHTLVHRTFIDTVLHHFLEKDLLKEVLHISLHN